MKKASVEECGSSVSKIGNIFNTKRETLMHEALRDILYLHLMSTNIECKIHTQCK